MTSALTRRTRWLLVAGAVILALLVNVAWVAFGPGDGGDRGKVEDAVRSTWTAKGLAPRTVHCREAAGAWSCDIEPARGRTVHCAIGSATAFFSNPVAALEQSCRSE